MADERKPQGPVAPVKAAEAPQATGGVTNEALLQALQAIAQGMQNQQSSNDALRMIAESLKNQQSFNEFAKKNTPKPRKTLAQYLKEKPRKRLHRETFQNGRPINPKGLAQETLDLLDTVATGLYGEGLEQVQVVRVGKGRTSRIHLYYSTKHENQKMAIWMKYPTLTSMIKSIHAEMAQRALVDPAYKPVVEEVPDPVEVEIEDITG